MNFLVFRKSQNGSNFACLKYIFNIHHFPKIKLAKHKTTGKGATKTGEWVFQEHDRYPGQDKIGEDYNIPEAYLLPKIGLDYEPLKIADNTTKFKVLEDHEKTEYYCTTRSCNVSCEVSNAPVVNCIQIQLVTDKDRHYYPMHKKLHDFYGAGGPSKSNENYITYKMIPESLRVRFKLV
jgi:hypothetical protein